MERPIFIIFSYTTDTNFSKPLCLLLGLCQNPYHVDCIYTLIPSYFRHIFSFYLVLVLSYFDKNIQVSQDIWLSLFQIFPLTSPFLFKKKKNLFSLWYFVRQSFWALVFLRVSYHALIFEWQPIWRQILFSKFEVLSFNALNTLPHYRLIHSHTIAIFTYKKNKQETLRAYKNKEKITYKETRMRLIDFSTVTLGAGNTFIRCILIFDQFLHFYF